MPLALLALAIGAFGIGTTEFVIMGLLPEVATDFGVSVPTAGLLVTGYGLGVMIGAPIMTLFGTKVSRKNMLMLLMGVFVLGNLVSALAPAFGVMMAGRILASFTHGAFFGIGSVVAADLVAPEKKARAISMMFAGLTVANVIGVPLGTFIGQSSRLAYDLLRRQPASASSGWPVSSSWCPTCRSRRACACATNWAPSATCRSCWPWR